MCRRVDEPLDHVILGGDAPGTVPGDRLAQEFGASVLVVVQVHAQDLEASGRMATAGE